MGQADQVSKLSTVAVSLVYLDHGDIYLGLAHLLNILWQFSVYELHVIPLDETKEVLIFISIRISVMPVELRS